MEILHWVVTGSGALKSLEVNKFADFMVIRRLKDTPLLELSQYVGKKGVMDSK